MMRLNLSGGVAGIVLGLWTGVVAGAAPGSFTQDASDLFFARETVSRISIEITGTNLAELQRNDREYVRCTVREGGTVYEDVGVHLKGAAGSKRGLDDKPALTLNFDKFVKRQAFHGLDKLHLNNSVQDPTCMTEDLCGGLFMKAGVPATRVAHARVELNGRDRGLYVLKEGFDKTFLKRHFKNPDGNLYDGGFLNEITAPLNRSSGSGPDNHADLKALAAAAQESDPARRASRLDELLDMDRFLSFVALEVITGHWDGYALKRNNYRIYHDPDSDRIVFLPHGMDQMFHSVPAEVEMRFEGTVAEGVVTTPRGRARYRERFLSIYTNYFKIHDLTWRICELQNRIRPALQEMDPELARRHDGDVAGLRQRVLQRAVEFSHRLGLPDPMEPTFDPDGVFDLSRFTWEPESREGQTRLSVSTGGAPSLAIAADGRDRSIGSWRTRLQLPRGSYRFQGDVTVEAVTPMTGNDGSGAGLRISGATLKGDARLTGDAKKRPLTHAFEVGDPRSVELVCELRAGSGRASFESLRLVRQGPGTKDAR